MNKQTIKTLCEQIIMAANATHVCGEANMAQLMGICRAARQIAAEASKPQEEHDPGQESANI